MANIKSAEAPVKGIGATTTGSTTPTEDLQRPSEEGLTTGHLGYAKGHVFSDPANADYWRLKYEKAGYENRHRFDPEAEWSVEEERKIVRKVNPHRVKANDCGSDSWKS